MNLHSLNTVELIQSGMDMAHYEAQKSKCIKKKVGAILMRNQMNWLQVVGKGYGGAKDECTACMKKVYEWSQDGCWSMHSEPRALFNHFENFRYNKDLRDCIMIVTHGPCDQCIKYCHFFGIKNMVYDISYHNDYTKWSGKINIYRLERSKLIKEN